MREAEKLRELAAWYREFAERAGNPFIWESRLRMAEDLEREAAQMLREHAARKRHRGELLTLEDTSRTTG
jgi:hypothetical protein